jgi:hypothetical protein
MKLQAPPKVAASAVEARDTPRAVLPANPTRRVGWQRGESVVLAEREREREEEE